MLTNLISQLLSVTIIQSQHSNSYATVLSLSDNAHISWYTTPEVGGS